MLNKPWIPALSRWLAGFLVVFAAFLWWLLIGDVYVSARYSSSFTRFAWYETPYIIYTSVGACVLAAGFSLFSAIRAPAQRLRSCTLLAISLCLVPAAWLYSRHVAATTVDAFLDPRPSIRDTLLNP